MMSGSSFSFFLGPKSPSSRGENIALAGMMIISGVVLLLIGVYYLLNPRSVIGDSLVNTSTGNPSELPPPQMFPVYAKPVTILFIALIVFAFCFFSLVQKPVLQRMPRGLLSFFLVLSVVLFAMSIYEILFNFSLWSSLLVTRTLNPDQAVNIYPVNSVKVNLVYATKVFVALLFVTYFAIAAIRNSLETANT
ncbi:MAG: hypothetical protein ACYC7D_11075 [Nitrososphaerales archaeon]